MQMLTFTYYDFLIFLKERKKERGRERRYNLHTTFRCVEYTMVEEKIKGIGYFRGGFLLSYQDDGRVRQSCL